MSNKFGAVVAIVIILIMVALLWPAITHNDNHKNIHETWIKYNPKHKDMTFEDFWTLKRAGILPKET